MSVAEVIVQPPTDFELKGLAAFNTMQGVAATSPRAAEAMGALANTLLTKIDGGSVGQTQAEYEDLTAERSAIDKAFTRSFKELLAEHDKNQTALHLAYTGEDIEKQHARADAEVTRVYEEVYGEPRYTDRRSRVVRVGSTVCRLAKTAATNAVKGIQAATQAAAETVQGLKADPHIRAKTMATAVLASLPWVAPAAITVAESVQESVAVTTASTYHAYANPTPQPSIAEYTGAPKYPKNPTQDDIAFAEATRPVDWQGIVEQQLDTTGDNLYAFTGVSLAVAISAGAALIKVTRRNTRLARRQGAHDIVSMHELLQPKNEAA